MEAGIRWKVLWKGTASAMPQHERTSTALAAEAIGMKRVAQFVICVGNKGYAASLELRKIYQVTPDKAATSVDQIRVIDESGEDYLYPEDYFLPAARVGKQ